MALSPSEYYDATIGRLIDMDGYPKEQPYQCVDLFKDFCFYQIGFDPKSLCQSTGYARDIWYNFEKLGLNKYFDKVAVNEMLDGDFAIWDFSSTSPYSHVAMFRWDNKNGTGTFLGQNQRGIPVSQVSIPYSGILGALRPKVYYQIKTEYINVPPTIEARAIFRKDTKQWFACIKPRKYNGLSYKVYSYVNNKYYAEIETVNYGRCLIRITGATPITNSPQYQNGNY